MEIVEQKEETIKKFACQSPCLCFNIRKAARAITQLYDNMFRDIGLTASQTAILSSIRRIGDMTVTQLADAMATDRTTITRNLGPLQRDGYLKTQEGKDRREKIIVITDKGRQACAQSMVIWEKFQERLDQRVGKKRVEQLCCDLTSMTDELKGLEE